MSEPEHRVTRIGISRDNLEHAVRAFGVTWKRGSAPPHVQSAVERVLASEARRLLADEPQGDPIEPPAGGDRHAGDRETDDFPPRGA
jgi:hypothetical protein